MAETTKTTSQEIKAIVNKLRMKGISAISSMDAAEQVQVATWAQEVFDSYGSVLEKYPSKIKDVSRLPCTKQDIKIAIKVLLPIWIAKESEDMINVLKDRYTRLSTFQKITAEDKEATTGEVGGVDQKSESIDISASSTGHKYMDIILAEQKVLLDEINSYINELQIPTSDS